MKRIIIPAMLVAVLLLGGSGCMQNNHVQNNPMQNINGAALAYMEQKYGERFAYAAPYGDSMTGTHQLLVTCASLPDESILVRVENYRRDDKVFLDNYLAVKYRGDTAAFLQSSADQVFGDATVFYDVDMQALSPELSANATLDDFLADTRVPLNVMVEVKAESTAYKDLAQQFADLLAVKGSHYYLSIVFVDGDKYDVTDSKALEQLMVSGEYSHCAKITRLGDEIKVRWLEEE
ncbi:MAG: hypothetical protein LBC26_01510 [Oscillospiraceae bacterium]|nr:hypothetical protein [Oscillospiraceae bacterium]